MDFDARRLDGDEVRDLARRSPGGECWHWVGTPATDGFGRWRKKLAHRAVWELLRGPLGEGEILRRKCADVLCVNPAHLEAGPRLVTGRWSKAGGVERAALTAAKIEGRRPRIEGDVAYVPLPDGREALVDAADVAAVSGYAWYAKRRPHHHTDYVCRDTSDAERAGGAPTRMMLHRHLFPPPPGLQTDHINWNGLDNRRSNLRHVTHVENQANRRDPATKREVRSTKGRTAKLRGEGKLPPLKSRGKTAPEVGGLKEVLSGVQLGPSAPKPGSRLIEKGKKR